MPIRSVNSVIGNGTSGTMSVTTSGTGTWVLTGANTYTGTTTVNGGTLQLNPGGVINGTASAACGHGQLLINGGTLTAGASSTIGAGSTG
jgi:fibronectin-binding autotransporter adhesin